MFHNIFHSLLNFIDFNCQLFSDINNSEFKKKPKPEKTKDTNISKLPLDRVDADNVAGVELKNVDTLECGQRFDFSSGSSIAIQTKNYPRNYPGSSWWNGYAGNCDWHFSVPTEAELRMLCDSFDVKRREETGSAAGTGTTGTGSAGTGRRPNPSTSLSMFRPLTNRTM